MLFFRQIVFYLLVDFLDALETGIILRRSYGAPDEVDRKNGGPASAQVVVVSTEYVIPGA